MKIPRSLVLATLAVATLPPLRGGIDLTPNPSSYEVEGYRIPCVLFRDGSQQIQYAPPSGWQLSGGGAQLRLCPDDATQADAIIEVLPSLSEVPAEESHATLARLVAAALPRDAENIEMLGATVNPLRIERAGTVEFNLRFQYHDASYQTSVLLMRRGRDLWRLSLTARVGDFPRLNETYRASLFTLQTIR